MILNSIIQTIMADSAALESKIVEQLYLVGLSTALALMIGIPVGIFLAYFPKLKGTILGIVSTLWTIPSLALLAFFIPFLGIGVKPAIITLAFYSILPILRNTVVGLETVPEATIEAANGLGFTQLQRLWIVELPLATPVIVAGIRTAVSINVGVATLAAFVGAGGLGDFINQGLALNNSTLILMGAIPAAIMALFLDFAIGWFEKLITAKTYHQTKMSRKKGLVSIFSILFILVVLSFSFISTLFVNKDNVIRIASKNFTEQIILGELMAQMIEAKTKLKVMRKFNLGTTAICHAAIINGEIDLYPEYTGTAYMTILKLHKPENPEKVFKTVKQKYLEQFRLVWLPPFGFNNTQAITITRQFSKKFHLKNISDLIPIEDTLIMGAPAEFIKREDAYPGLQRAYGLDFAIVKQMDPGLVYKAINTGKVNVIMAFSTDGRILAYDLVVLNDDKGFFPPYFAAPLIRAEFLEKHPEIMIALKPLLGLLTDPMMQQLNYRVDMLKQSPAWVAHEFLSEHGLVN